MSLQGQLGGQELSRQALSDVCAAFHLFDLCSPVRADSLLIE